MFDPVSPKVDVQEVEKAQLAFWRERDVFQRTMREREEGQRYVFYEGPPTANGRPGTHHVLARAFKDMFPRYKTMRGCYVLRKGGWDTHGLPVEIEVEKQLGLTHKGQIEEYGIAQLSLNLNDIDVTPVHVAFDEACKSAQERGIRVTGSELVGLIPKQALLDAADHYLLKQQRSLGISEREKIHIAVKSLGLDDLAPFDPRKKVIEYQLEDEAASPLVNLSLTRFTEETARETPAPGGGSVAAIVGSMGAALGQMVANLSANKRGWDERWEEFSAWAEKAERYRVRLLQLVDEDTRAYERIMQALQMPKGSDEEKQARKTALHEATKGAILVPLETLRVCVASMEVAQAMASIGMPSSVSDAGVGVMCARTGALAAYLNVRTNFKGFDDAEFQRTVMQEAEALKARAEQTEKEVMEATLAKL